MRITSRHKDVRASMSQLAATVLAVSLAFAMARMLYGFENGHALKATLVGAVALAQAACAVGWWRRRPNGRGRVFAALAGMGGLAVWLLADNTFGVPMFAVAICVLVIEFGIWAGTALGATMLAVVFALYLQSENVPFGGVAFNIVVVVAVVLTGLASALLVAQLDHAIQLEAEASRLRREEALAEMDRVLADERMEYARLLHDELGQRLTVIGMGLDLATRLRAPDANSGPDSAAWEEVERSRSEAAEALGELRTLVRSMSPLGSSEVRRLDLGAALDTIAAKFDGTGLNVRLEREAESADAELDPLAYRIIQEGLTNVARHSGAEHVKVSIAAGERRIIRIHDDGGAAPSRPSEGFGLLHLRERVEAAGGTLRAESGENGFELDASYPLGSVPE